MTRPRLRRYGVNCWRPIPSIEEAWEATKKATPAPITCKKCARRKARASIEGVSRRLRKVHVTPDVSEAVAWIMDHTEVWEEPRDIALSRGRSIPHPEIFNGNR